MAPRLGSSHVDGQDGAVHEAHRPPRPWSWQHLSPQMISGNPVSGSDPLQQNAFPQALPKHLPGQHSLPHAGLPVRQGAATAPLAVAPRSAPAIRTRQAVRRDLAVPKRRVTVSKTWWSISRSSAQTWWMKRDIAAGSMSCPRSPTRGPRPWMATSDDRAQLTFPADPLRCDHLSR